MTTTMTTTREFNFDGLIGPTHHYAGLSFGNVASTENKQSVANPREAALQGLAKMWALAQRGFGQAVLPPQIRPNLNLLRQLGFTGTNEKVISSAARTAPTLLATAYSAASMWTANAATVSPSADTPDGRVHITVANLTNKLHRCYEQVQTEHVLRTIFSDQTHFVVHSALPASPALGDEGAANHMRLCAEHGAAGVEIFVYGRSEFDSNIIGPQKYPARQTKEASQAIARLHGLLAARAIFIQQNPNVIDLGVFHNDVIAVSSNRVLFYHQDAFVNEATSIEQCRAALQQVGAELIAIRVENAEVSVEGAVSSYLFNSQLLQKPNVKMLLIIPQECKEKAKVAQYLSELVSRNEEIDEVLYFDLRQSMRNGGGPACLRLRVVLTEQQANAMHQGIVLTEALYKRLVAWVELHYRDQLRPEDLADPALMVEVQSAFDALEKILDLKLI